VGALGKVFKGAHSPFQTPLVAIFWHIDAMMPLDPFSWILAIFEPNHQDCCLRNILSSIVGFFLSFEGNLGSFQILFPSTFGCWSVGSLCNYYCCVLLKFSCTLILILELSPFAP